jgi:O-methyltransferase involved in polyketide biosynthesis
MSQGQPRSALGEVGKGLEQQRLRAIGGRHVRHSTVPAVLPLSPVPRTMLIPLWARAAEMRKRHPLVQDARALEICGRIDYDFNTFRRAYGTQIGCVLRGLLYDRWVADFLSQHPGGTIVELGAGLGTRFERIDDGRARWIDVDLPEAIALRREHFEPSARRIFLAASVLDPGWPDLVRKAAPGPYYFVSEGMLMYLAAADVRAVILRIADEFGPCELALDSIGESVVRHQSLHDSMKHMMDAPFQWGIDDIRDIERWDPRGGVHVEEVATLPEIAMRFRERVSLAHRVAGAIVRWTLPSFGRAYRLSRVSLGASQPRSNAASRAM